ncbi:LysR family transcriptional regulator [Thiocapsa imhoffii]|uniref:LysR family transcriptional regulator n=1 Tax=Thiocapsa imhoffii TaxID=382777 RepID=A0A9X0WHI5_9GAMM|nr:LysR family transcriptional regulator [Thiocapsa imhoffii]MBK1644670.1 LysR family transcriptional regulator [Thiocapsa imhoffii]
MDSQQINTFLAVAAHGSFQEAATRVHVTQSTVSARIQAIEQELNARLFVRNRSGATLTAAGQRFLRHAKTLALTFDQARHDVGLPSRFRGSLRIGARIALWDGLLPLWVGRMRAQAPDLSINSDIGFEEDLMRGIIVGTLDLALMYSPRHCAGLQIEHLFDETLVRVCSDPQDTALDDSYVYVDWGPTFYAQHQQVYPDLERPALMANIGWLGLQLILANGGSCFVPERIAASSLRDGSLHLAPHGPRFRLPAYVVHSSQDDSSMLDMALGVLRALVREQTTGGDAEPEEGAPSGRRGGAIQVARGEGKSSGRRSR